MLRKNHYVVAASMAGILGVAVLGSRLVAQSGHRHSVGKAAHAEDLAKPKSAQPLLRQGEELVEERATIIGTPQRTLVTLLDQGRELIALENLNLQRILDISEAKQFAVVWHISGTVTEYRGRNYVLISRALLKSTSASTNEAKPAGRPKSP